MSNHQLSWSFACRIWRIWREFAKYKIRLFFWFEILSLWYPRYSWVTIIQFVYLQYLFCSIGALVTAPVPLKGAFCLCVKSDPDASRLCCICPSIYVFVYVCVAVFHLYVSSCPYL